MTAKPTDFEGLLRRLHGAQVEFIIVGGLAGIIHGSAHATVDVDVVYRRSSDNLARLVRALSPISPYLRGTPAGLPFTFDQQTLNRGLNFPLETALGDIDLLGEIAGGGYYEDLVSDSAEMQLFGAPTRVVTLRKLVMLKRAAGRRKDLNVIAELEALLEEQDRSE